MTQNQQSNRRDLRHHLDFSELGGADGETLSYGDAAQSIDRELPSHNDNHHPCLDNAKLDQGNEGRGDQKLVGDRVQKCPERRNLPPLSSEIAVQEVGQRRRQENKGGHQHVILGQQQRYE